MKQDILDVPQVNHNVSVVRIEKSGWCSIETIHHANAFLNSEAVTLTDLWDQQSESFQALILNTHLLIMVLELGDSANLSIVEHLAGMSKKSSTLVIGITMLPFSFEGRKRKENANQALPVLKEILGSLIVIEKDSYIPQMDPTLKIPEAYKFMDQVVRNVINTIVGTVTNSQNNDILVNITDYMKITLIATDTKAVNNDI